MRACSAILASAYSFVNQEAPREHPPSSLLRGRWMCAISEPVEDGVSRAVATGLLDVLHAGSYLVGSGWLDGAAGERGFPEGGSPLPSAGLEGPMFGAIRGDEVILWISNVFRTAMWVLRGTLAPRGRIITGTALYTDVARGTQWSYEARFVLTGT